MPAERSTVESLRIPKFRRLWVASLFFNVGHLVQVVASSWVMLELTASPLWVSLMVGAPLLPQLFLAIPAGAAADLLDRRRLIVVASAVVVCASAGMSVAWAANVLTPGLLLTFGLMVGVGATLFQPAWQAIMPSLVPMSLLPGAVALNSASGGVAFAVGPALGGILVALLGPGWTFGVATVSYTSILLAVLRTRTGEVRSEAGSLTVAMTTGLRFLRFSAGYRWLLLVGALFGFSSSSVRALLPNVTSDLLLGDSEIYGLLLGAFGVGALLGGLTRRRAGAMLGPSTVSTGMIVFGAAGAGLAWSTHLWVSLSCILVVGVAWTWVLATLNTTFQMLTPDWVRGRAMSAFVLSVFGFQPIGSIASGALANVIGISGSVMVFCATVALFGVLATSLPLPALEQVDPPVVPGVYGSDPTGMQNTQGPVMVMTTWTMTEEEFEPFVEVLAELRLIRLSTGAYHWSASRSLDDFRRISEVFLVHSWEQYLQQHRRLDERARSIVERAESFVDGASVSHQLIRFEVDDPRRRPDWQELAFQHEQLHRPPDSTA